MEYSKQLLMLLEELLKVIIVAVTLYLIGTMVEAKFDYREWAGVTRWSFAISFLMLLDYFAEKKLTEWLKKTTKSIYGEVRSKVKQFRRWY